MAGVKSSTEIDTSRNRMMKVNACRKQRLLHQRRNRSPDHTGLRIAANPAGFLGSGAICRSPPRCA